MVTPEEYRNALRAFIKRTAGAGSSILAKVASVNETDYTCDLIDDDENATPYKDVRLRPVLDGQESITIFPKEGTWALAVQIEDTEDWMIIAVGEAEKYRIKIGTISFEMTSAGIVFNGGTLDGLVKLNDLVTKLNHVEDDLNALKAVFKTAWVVVPSDGGAALKTAATAWANNSIIKTVKADLENTKVKQ